MSTQLELPAANLSRVRSAIAPHIVRFWQQRLLGQASFHCQDLHAYVRSFAPRCAPPSADRIMRDLRRDGIINYRLVKRSASLYQALPLGVAAEDEAPAKESVGAKLEALHRYVLELEGRVKELERERGAA